MEKISNDKSYNLENILSNLYKTIKIIILYSRYVFDIFKIFDYLK